MHARCLECRAEYPTTRFEDYGLCPRCQAQEDRIYAARPDWWDFDPPSWTRAAMRERLGVSGDVDE